MTDARFSVWEYLKIIYNRKLLIITIVILSAALSFLLSTLTIKDEYQTSIKLNVSKRFLDNKGKIKIEELKSLFHSAEVLDSPVVDSKIISSNFYTTADNFLEIKYRHLDNSQTKTILNNWINCTKIRFYWLESSNLKYHLWNEIKLMNTRLTKANRTKETLEKMLEEEEKFIYLNSEKDLAYSIHGINPAYADFQVQINTIKTEIAEIEFLLNLLTKAHDEVKLLFEGLDLTTLASEERIAKISSDLESGIKQYEYYLDQKDTSSLHLTTLESVPFTIESEPVTKIISNKYKIKVNLFSAIILSFFIGCLLAIILELSKKTLKKMPNEF